MADKILSEDLKFWRCERPDEWKMDVFIRKAIELEKGVGVKPTLSDGWRDMQKEPPTTTDEVMFYSRTDRIIEIGRYINGKCYGRSGMYRDGQATAWRELPDPPAFA